MVTTKGGHPVFMLLFSEASFTPVFQYRLDHPAGGMSTPRAGDQCHDIDAGCLLSVADIVVELQFDKHRIVSHSVTVHDGAEIAEIRVNPIV